MISSDVLLGSQDILDDSSWGPQKRFFGFSLGGYLEGGVNAQNNPFWSLSLFLLPRMSSHIHLEKSRRIPSAFWDLRRKSIFPFSHESFVEVGKFLGPNGTTHEIDS